MFKIIQFTVDNFKKILLTIIIFTIILAGWDYKICSDNAEAVRLANDGSSGIPDKMFKSDNDISDYKQKIIIMETAVMLNRFKVASND